MPLYTYVCDSCETAQEHIVRSAERDKPVPCSCGGEMKRQGVETFAVGQPEYQMAGIFADGTHVPGHFAKDAKRRRKKR